MSIWCGYIQRSDWGRSQVVSIWWLYSEIGLGSIAGREYLVWLYSGIGLGSIAVREYLVWLYSEIGLGTIAGREYLVWLYSEIGLGSIAGRECLVWLYSEIGLYTFYLRLYGVRHMVKDHSGSEKGHPLPLHRLLFPINSKGSFICTERIAHTTAFVTPVVDHWLEREIRLYGVGLYD